MPLKDHPFIALLLHARNYLSASIATKAMGFISLPVMTRLLSPAEYGVFNVFTSYIGLLVIVLSLNNYSSIGRYWYEDLDDFNSFFGTSIFFTGGVLVFSCIFYWIFYRPLGRLAGLPENLVLWMIPFVIVGIISSTFLQVYQPQRRSKLIATLSIAEAYLGFGASVCLVLMMKEQRYYGVLWGRLIVSCVMSAIMIRYLRPYFKPVFQKKHLRYILGYSIPMIPYMLSGPILSQFDRIMINSYMGSASAGLYSLAYNIGVLLSLLITALLSAWNPDYFEDMNNKNYRKLNSDTDKIFRLVLSAAMFLMLFGKEIGMVLVDQRYHSGLKIVPVVVFGYIFTALWQFWGRNIGYSKKTIWISIVATVAGSVNIGLNMVFIPRYGYVAGAYTTVISFMIMAFSGWIVSKFVLKGYTTPILIFLKPLSALILLYVFYVCILKTIDLEASYIIYIKLLFFGIFIMGIAWKYMFYLKLFLLNFLSVR